VCSPKEPAWLDDRVAFDRLVSSLITESMVDAVSTEARCAELQALALASDRHFFAACLGTLRASALYGLGRVSEAYAIATETVPILRQQGDPEHLSRALGGLGLIQNGLGDRASAVASLTEALSLAEEHGLGERARSAHLNIGFIYYLENCREEALNHFRLAISEDPDDFVSGVATSNVAAILIDMEEFEKAGRQIEDGLAVQASRYIRGLLYGNDAMILAHRGDVSALSLAEHAVEHLIASGRNTYAPMAHYDVARIYWKYGFGDSALAAITRAAQLSASQPSRPYDDEIKLLQAKIFALNGNFEESTKILLAQVETMQTKFPGQIKVSLELSQKRWEADWARKETDLLRSVNQELTEARKQADRANAMKSQFLANMSHEIRTPLNGVIGMSALLLEMELTDVSRDYIHCIKSSGETLLSIINDVLDLSKIESGKMTIELEEFGIETVVDDVMATMQSKAMEKELEFLAVIDEQVPRTLRGDPHHLKQIWANLIGNGLKFTEAGSVVVRLNWEPVDEHRGFLVSTVHDTGIGISEEAQQTIFDSFSQAGANTTRLYGGTGLGLTISRELAREMGGDLTVVSRPGLGSAFTCRIPVQAVALATKLHEDAQACLIVGESQNGLESLSAILRACGFAPFALGERMQRRSRSAGWHAVFVSETWLQFNDLGKVLDTGPGTGSKKVIVTTSEMGRANHGFPVLQRPFRHTQVRSLLKGHDDQAKRAAFGEGVLAGKRFLVVEDNLVNQRILSGLLERSGAWVEIAENGEVGLAAMKESDFDIIFMDCQMPIVDGFKCTQLIREIEVGTGQHRQIIALTANATETDRNKCLQAGMDDYLTKPITPKALHAAIARAFGDENGAQAVA